MSYAEEIRNKIYGRICPENYVYVAIYARVSTNNDGQKCSCDNQVAYAKDFIAKYPNIQLKEVFVDDGISGKNSDNRPQFQKMMETVKRREIQGIVIKDYSRSNRSVISFEIEELLKENKVTFINMTTGMVDDLEDPNAMVSRHIQYIMDAKTVQDQSHKGHVYQHTRCTHKILTAKDCTYGYEWNKDTKVISVNHSEAEIVRWIFDEYIYRNGTPASISKILKEKGISMSERTISNIIKNEKYIGKFYINKRSTILGTGHNKTKRFKLPKKDWVLCERPDLQIIDSDVFDMAQRVHQSRITIYEKPGTEVTQARFRGTHLYSRLIFCACCGKPYQFDYADRKQTQAVYRIKKHSNCENPNRRLSEQEVDNIIRLALKNLIGQQSEIYARLESVLCECVKASHNNSGAIKKLKKQETEHQKKINNLLKALEDTDPEDTSIPYIRERLKAITKEKTELADSIKSMESNQLDDGFITKKMASITNAMNDLLNFDTLNRDRVLNYIERIECAQDGSIEVVFKSKERITLKQPVNSIYSVEECVGKKGKQGMMVHFRLATQIVLQIC